MKGYVAEGKSFEEYFVNKGFSDFNGLFNCSVEEFKDNYEQFIVEVSEYFRTYKGDSNYPLTAEVCGVCSIDFFATLESTKSMVKYPAVSVLKGEYYATVPRVEVEYKTFEEVMKELLMSYFSSFEFYEEMKKLAESYIPTEYKYVGGVEGLEDEDFPF